MYTPLHFAAEWDKLSMLDALIEECRQHHVLHEALSAKDTDGRGPLFCTCSAAAVERFLDCQELDNLTLDVCGKPLIFHCIYPITILSPKILHVLKDQLGIQWEGMTPVERCKSILI